jgi:FkbM family methyltransferase
VPARLPRADLHDDNHADSGHGPRWAPFTFEGNMSHPDQWWGDKTFSQHGEDLMILNIARQLGIEKGSYLDVGAHHPENISNTALLYARGWRGCNVDANPNVIAKFRELRPEDRTIHAAVVPSSAFPTATLHMVDPWSGRNSVDNEEILRAGLDVSDRVEVPAMTLAQVLGDASWPNLLSIDIEGWTMTYCGAVISAMTSPRSCAPRSAKRRHGAFAG